MSTPLGPSGWHPDPLGRFEYRYYNGLQWTADVSVGGQRFVDPSGAPSMPPYGINPSQRPRRTRGHAVASFVVGLVALLIGWVPIVVGLAIVGVVLGLVFGITGVRRAKVQDGFGRGFAVAGLVLSAVAVPVCVIGLFLSAKVIREVNEYVNPAPYSLGTVSCVVENGMVSASGSITNDGTTTHSYVVEVWIDVYGITKKENVQVRNLAPGVTSHYETQGVIFLDVNGDGSGARCQVHQVYGPPPFGLDPDDLQGNN